MIRVASDSEGIFLAACSMLEIALEEPKNERRLQSIDPMDLVQTEKLGPKFKLSPGYEDRVGFLVWLKDRMDAGVVFADLTADEADGIASIVRARAHFEADHPPCGHCGHRLADRMLLRCNHCGKELH